MEQLALFPDAVKPRIGIFGMNDFGIMLLEKFKKAGYQVLAYNEDPEMLTRIALECDFVFMNVATNETLEYLCDMMDEIQEIKDSNKVAPKIYFIKAPAPKGTHRMLQIVYDQDVIILVPEEFVETGEVGSSNIDTFPIVQKHLNEAFGCDINYVDPSKFEY